MGTSSVKKSYGRTTQGRSNDIAEKVGKAASIADTAISLTIPYWPNGPAKAPIYFGVKQLMKFCKQASDDGVEEATKTIVKDIAKDQLTGYVTSQISAKIWDDCIEDQLSLKDSPEIKSYAKDAFHRTMEEIISLGVDAIASK